MYKLSVYENKMSFSYRIESTTYRWKWQAIIASFIVLAFACEQYRETGVYLTTKIEKI